MARGHYVIRHDNRDIGLSQKFDSAGLPDMVAIGMAMMTGKQLPASSQQSWPTATAATASRRSPRRLW